MKFCKDCKCHRPDTVSSSSRYDLCCSPKSETQSPINGEEDFMRNFCLVLRESAIKCTMDAKWFEPKENNNAKI